MTESQDAINFVSFSGNILNFWGMWPVERGHTWRLYILHSSHTLLVFIIMSTLVLGQLCDIYSIFGNIVAVTENSTLLFTTVSLMCKLISIMMQKAKFKRLLDFLRSDDFKPKTKQYLQIYMKRMETCRRTSKIYSLISIVALVGFLLFPAIEQSRRLPCSIKYPYLDLKPTPMFEIAYTYLVLSLTGLALMNSSVDILIFGFLSQANILTMCRIFFNVSMFVQYIVSGVVMCCSGIQMVTLNPGDQPIKLVALLSYLIAMLSEIFMLCWCGNEIMAKTEYIGEALYNTTWMDCSPKFKQSVRIFMVRARIPLIVMAGKMFKLNLSSFTTILNSSYSYFALLRHIYTAGEEAVEIIE